MESIGIERDGSGRIKIYCSPFSNMKLKLEVRSQKGNSAFFKLPSYKNDLGGEKKRRRMTWLFDLIQYF